MSKRNITKKTLDKYKKVVDEWFNNDFNGKQAYLKFYPNVKPDTATTNFSKISVIPEVEEYINFKNEEAAKIVEMTHEGILRELKSWVESDITQVIGLSPEQVKQLPVSLRRLVNKFKHTKNKNYSQKGELLFEQDTIELSFVSKERALEMINKHLGFYEADNKQKAPQINYNDLSPKVLLEIWNARKQD